MIFKLDSTAVGLGPTKCIPVSCTVSHVILNYVVLQSDWDRLSIYRPALSHVIFKLGSTTVGLGPTLCTVYIPASLTSCDF